MLADLYRNLVQLFLAPRYEMRILDTSFFVEIGFVLALALLEIFLHLGECADKKIVLAAGND